MKWIVIDDPTLPTEMRNKKFFQLMQRSRGAAKNFDQNMPLKLKQKFGKDFEIWAQFQGLGKRVKQGRRKYEIFCGGFLYYHDAEYKKYQTGVGPDNQNYPDTFIDTDGKEYPSKNFEHMIFFEWVESSKDKLKLRIYINSTPKVLNTNPPPPPKPPPPES